MIEDLEGAVRLGLLKRSHTSQASGYISRKPGGEVIEPYKGRFGKGFVLRTPNWDSTRYHYITYYLEV